MAEENVNIIEEPKEPSSFKLILTLSLAGFLSGLVLVAAFIYTKPMIERNKAEALREAIYKVLPGTTHITELELRDGQLDVVMKGEGGEQSKSEKIYLGWDSLDVMIGFAIPGAEPGFQDIIGAIFGYSSLDRKIIGLEILESKETPGLGDKIFKDQDFAINFKHLKVEPEIVFVKKDAKVNENEVEGITGATISSKAIVRLLNNSVNQWKEPIDEFLKRSVLSKNQIDE